MVKNTKYLFFLILMLCLCTACGKEAEEPSDFGVGSSGDFQITESAETDSLKEGKVQEITDKEKEELLGKLADNGEEHPIVERQEKNGKMQSWLTGEWKDAQVVRRRNMAVMIDNSLSSLPQYGISKASIIYEAPVEGRITRLMGYFEDYDELDHIGPVRSSRDYYIYEAMPTDSIYCNWGLARPWVEELINSDRIDNVSQALAGIYKGAPEAFDRIERPGFRVEHTSYMFIDGYKTAVERLGYEKEYRDSFVKVFEFADEGYRATYSDCDSATKIYPGGMGNNAGGYGQHKPCFAYNEKDGLYYRTQFDQAQIDEMNGEQLSVTNIVFKVCTGEERLPNDPNYDYLAFDTIGIGNAYLFTNGKIIKGNWIHESENEPNYYVDANGKEIVLNQGKTWVCCIWKDYEEYIYWE